MFLLIVLTLEKKLPVSSSGPSRLLRISRMLCFINLLLSSTVDKKDNFYKFEKLEKNFYSQKLNYNF